MLLRFCCSLSALEVCLSQLTRLRLAGKVKANEEVEIWMIRGGQRKGGSSNHPLATRSHSASAGPSINTYRKSFPGRPLWFNQSMHRNWSSLHRMCYPSDSPAPGHMNCLWLALKPAHILRIVHFNWVTGEKWCHILFLGELNDFQQWLKCANLKILSACFKIRYFLYNL